MATDHAAGHSTAAPTPPQGSPPHQRPRSGAPRRTGDRPLARADGNGEADGHGRRARTGPRDPHVKGASQIPAGQPMASMNMRRRDTQSQHDQENQRVRPRRCASTATTRAQPAIALTTTRWKVSDSNSRSRRGSGAGPRRGHRRPTSAVRTRSGPDRSRTGDREVGGSALHLSTSVRDPPH